MIILFHEKKLWSVVKGTKTKPNVRDPTSKHEKRKIWQHNWRLCLTYESTNEFEAIIDGNQAMTLNILVTLKMKYDDEMIEFINTWKSKLDDRLIAQVDINQKFQSLLLLGALPNSWKNFVKWLRGMICMLSLACSLDMRKKDMVCLHKREVKIAP